MIRVGNVKILIKYVQTFGTGRHKLQADITLLFQYIIAKLDYYKLSVHEIATESL